jgi:signal transduction histidine kinase
VSNGPPGGWPRPRSRFVEWAEQIDPELRRLFQFPRRWLISVFAYATAIAGISAIPGLRDFFRVDPVPVVAAQLLALAVTMSIYHYENLHPVSPYPRGAGVLAIAFCFQLVFSTTVAFSEPPGTYVFAALPLMGIWLHVAAIGGSWRHPYPQLAHGAAMLTGLSLNPDPEHVAVFATIIPLGLAGSFISGSLTAELSGQRSALASFRSAIGAQVLAGRREDVDKLSGELAHAQRLALEMREALRAALGRAERLVEDARNELPATLLRTELAGLEGSLRALAKSSLQIRALGRDVPTSSMGAPSVEAFALAREAVAAVAIRFPHVAIQCTANGPRAEKLRVTVGRGDDGFRQIVEYAVANACEGNGSQGATRVAVCINHEPQLRLATLEVSDDGPGFPLALLAAPPSPFLTTKPGRPGLGLYTVERLARAGGGFLRRENGAGRGARVTVFLPETRDA